MAQINLKHLLKRTFFRTINPTFAICFLNIYGNRIPDGKIRNCIIKHFVVRLIKQYLELLL